MQNINTTFQQYINSIKNNEKEIQNLKKLGYITHNNQLSFKKRITITGCAKYPYLTLSGHIPNIFGNGEKFEFKIKKNFLSFLFIKPIFNQNSDISFLELKTYQTKKKLLGFEYPIDGVVLKKESKNFSYDFAIEKIYKNFVSYFSTSFNFPGINLKMKIGSVSSDQKISPFLKIISDFKILKSIKFDPKMKKKNYSFGDNFITNIFNDKTKNTIKLYDIKNSFKDKFMNFVINKTFKYPFIAKSFLKIRKNIYPENNNLNSKNLPEIIFMSKMRSGVVFGRPHPLDKFLLGRNIRGYPENSIGPVDKNNISLGNSFIEIKNQLSANFKNFEIFTHSDIGFCSKTQNLIETLKMTMLSMILKQPYKTFGASFGLGVNYLFPKIKNFAPKIGLTYSIPLTQVDGNERLKFNLDIVS
ncbi:hypothetical protein DMUE_2088 [Dictyocoela muelleri]|nr:hypothetical protein DMUE_2088 [Dictyocoela muelleri]